MAPSGGDQIPLDLLGGHSDLPNVPQSHPKRAQGFQNGAPSPPRDVKMVTKGIKIDSNSKAMEAKIAKQLPSGGLPLSVYIYIYI